VTDEGVTRRGRRSSTHRASPPRRHHAAHVPPGELQNVIERAVVLCDGETFSIDPSWLKRNAGGVSTQGA